MKAKTFIALFAKRYMYMTPRMSFGVVFHTIDMIFAATPQYMSARTMTGSQGTSAKLMRWTYTAMKRKWLAMKLTPPAENHTCPLGIRSTSPSQLVSSASSRRYDTFSVENT